MPNEQDLRSTHKIQRSDAAPSAAPPTAPAAPATPPRWDADRAAAQQSAHRRASRRSMTTSVPVIDTSVFPAVKPAAPAQTASPAQPAAPAQTAVSTRPAAQAQPVAPAQTTSPAQPTVSTRPAAQAQPVAPAQTTSPAQPTVSTRPAAQAQPVAPAQPLPPRPAVPLAPINQPAPTAPSGFGRSPAAQGQGRGMPIRRSSAPVATAASLRPSYPAAAPQPSRPAPAPADELDNTLELGMTSTALKLPDNFDARAQARPSPARPAPWRERVGRQHARPSAPAPAPAAPVPAASAAQAAPAPEEESRPNPARAQAEAELFQNIHDDHLWLNNPIMVRGLGLAPAIVAAASGRSALLLCAAAALLLTATRVLTVALCHAWGGKQRPLLYILSAAVVYIPAYCLLYAAFGSDLTALGIYLPLLVADPVIIKRMEAPELETVREAFGRGLNNTLGLCVALLLIGCLREVLAGGTVFGHTVLAYAPLPLAAQPAGGFLLVGLLAAVWTAAGGAYVRFKREEVRHLYAEHKQ